MKSSLTGTISGGLLMIRCSPSTIVVSLLRACWLVRVRALATNASVAAYLSALSWDLKVVRASSTSRWAYQTLINGCAANSRMARR